jgi:hypothetical protein
MNGLVITEANSLLDRPVLYQSGSVVRDGEVISTKMDQMYLKLATLNHAVRTHSPINNPYIVCD